MVMDQEFVGGFILGAIVISLIIIGSMTYSLNTKQKAIIQTLDNQANAIQRIINVNNTNAPHERVAPSGN